MGTDSAVLRNMYPVKDWMLPYFEDFTNTGGNDVVELLHDADTTAFANVVRYMLIVAVRSQYTLLVTLQEKGELVNGAPPIPGPPGPPKI